MSGWLVYNGGLTTPVFLEIYKWYQKTALEMGVVLNLVSNIEVLSVINNNRSEVVGVEALKKPEFVLFLDKDIRLAKTLETLGIRVFNSKSAIELCDDKSLTFLALSGKGIKLPKTIIAPLMFPGTTIDENKFASFLEDEINYPMVIKESFGSFGAEVYLVKNREEFLKKRVELKYKPHIYQEYIKSSHGKDVRLFVVGNKVVATMLRTSENDFRANVTNGGVGKNFEAPKSFINMAINAVKILGLDFAGVDILFGDDNEPILCEVNSNAHIKGIYNSTGIDLTKLVMGYILNELQK